MALPLAPTAHAAASSGIPFWGPLLSCTGNYGNVVSTTAVKNTCNDVCDLLHTTQNVVNFGITVTLFVAVPAMMAFGGILFMVGNPLGGDEKNKRSVAKGVIVSALTGAAIVLCAYLILNTFLWLVGNGHANVKRCADGSAVDSDGLCADNRPARVVPTDATPWVSWPDIKCELPPAVKPGAF